MIMKSPNTTAEEKSERWSRVFESVNYRNSLRALSIVSPLLWEKNIKRR